MITPKMEVLNLSHNKITKDGIVHLADKLQTFIDPLPKLRIINIKSNELNDFCVPAIRDIISHCKDELKIFDLSENLFLSSV